jgi:hypothetical protein
VKGHVALLASTISAISVNSPAKQITNFRRRFLRAKINPVIGAADNPTSQNDALYVLDLVGTASLYHQGQHIMVLVQSWSIPPSCPHSSISVVQPSAPGDPALPVVDHKPRYQIADFLSLDADSDV